MNCCLLQKPSPNQCKLAALLPPNVLKSGTSNKKHTSAVVLCGVTWCQARSALQQSNVYTTALYSEVPASNLGVVSGTLSDILSIARQIPADCLLYTPLRCHYLPSPTVGGQAASALDNAKSHYVTLHKNARYFDTPNGHVTAGLTLRNLSTTSEPTQRSRFNCFAVKRNRFLNLKGVNS